MACKAVVHCFNRYVGCRVWAFFGGRTESEECLVVSSVNTVLGLEGVVSLSWLYKSGVWILQL